ncbi:hypothetical protein GGR57DRAFT_506677 [Xylariaceae sp. FL1272]|nr:hypothetical protein GGR57DRAFT_506677 [Xylariaceae sp. FL1272]
MTNYYPAPTVIPIYSVYLGVGIFLTGLRIWVRTSFSRQPFGIDDYFILLGLATSAACTAIQYYNVMKGTGGAATKDANSQERSAIIGHQIDWAMIVIEKVGFGAVKLSILFFYRRIFGVWVSFRRINNVLIVIVAAWTLAFLLSDILLCGAHPEYIWGYDQKFAKEHCANRGADLLAFSVTSLATDLPILALPFFYISRLQMARQKKWASLFVFGLGTISVGASVIRLIFLIVSYPVGRLNFAYEAPPDAETPLVLQIFNPTFWALTELWLGLWAANLPPCGPLLRNFNIHPYQIIDSVRRSWQSRKSSSASEWSWKSSFRRPSQAVGSNGSKPSMRRPSEAPISSRKMSSRDDAPLVTIGGTVRYPNQSDGGSSFPGRGHVRWPSQTDSYGTQTLASHQEERVSMEEPPTLKPVDWTAGRLSVFDHMRSHSSSPDRG